MARIPETPTITNSTQNRAAVFFSSTVVGGSGTAHAQPYAWGTAANPSAWVASNSYSNGSAIPSTAAGAAVQSMGNAYLRVRDNLGCVSNGTGGAYTHPAIPADVTFCANCGYSGTAWVDMWIATAEEGSTPQFGCAGTAVGAISLSGRFNTNAIKLNCAATNNAASFCRNKGALWDVPSTDELMRASAVVTVNAYTMTSTEWISGCKSAGGTLCDCNDANTQAAVFYHNGGAGCYDLAKSYNGATYLRLRCTWRP